VLEELQKLTKKNDMYAKSNCLLWLGEKDKAMEVFQEMEVLDKEANTTVAGAVSVESSPSGDLDKFLMNQYIQTTTTTTRLTTRSQAKPMDDTSYESEDVAIEDDIV
jgi:hypothetical protein